MRAFVIAIGDELISGATIDTNSAWISSRLLAGGVGTVAHVTVPDELNAIREALVGAANRADLVIVSGGLGPTADDLTREGLAAAMGVPLVLDEDSLATIEAFFRQRNRPMNATNRIQAMMPEGSSPILNPLGTAPGISAMLGDSRVIVMPGVPSEMKGMFERAVAPLLGGGAGVLRVVHTFGMGESDVGAAIADLMDRHANPRVGTTVAGGMVSVRIVATGDDAAHAAVLAQRSVDEVRRRLGRIVVGLDEQTMAGAVGDLLRRRHQTLATAESCTGGLVGQLITSVAGSSDYYLGGVVTYSNRLKTHLLGVEDSLLDRHGAVSEDVAAEMARQCRQRLGSTWAISVTGIAGPGGGTADKPVGLVYIGLAGADNVHAWKLLLPGPRESVRLRASLAALDKLRLALLEE